MTGLILLRNCTLGVFPIYRYLRLCVCFSTRNNYIAFPYNRQTDAFSFTTILHGDSTFNIKYFFTCVSYGSIHPQSGNTQ